MFPFDSPEGLFSFNSLSIGAVGELAAFSGEKENSQGLWEKYEKRLPGSMTTPYFSSLGPGTVVSTEPMPDPRTILLTGLPADFKERELGNLFTFAEGFEQCSLSLDGCAYARFTTQDDARRAIRILDGRLLDPKNKILVRAELAKSNLIIDGANLSGTSTTASSASTTPFTVASVLATPFQPMSSTNRPSRSMTISVPGLRDPTVIEAPLSASQSDLAAPIPIPSNTQLIGSLSSQGSIEHSVTAPVQVQVIPGVQMQQGLGSLVQSSPTSRTPPTSTTTSTQQALQQPVKVQQSLPLSELSTFQRSLIAAGQLGTLAAVVGENFPCNTLYVGNLPPTTAEEELRLLFKHCFGYRRLSFKPKSSGPMCFVEFEDIACATAALETLYGTMLSCSNPAKGGIRLSYSKNPLGLRVASPVCDVSVLGNVHAVSSLIKIDGINGMSNSISGLSNSAFGVSNSALSMSNNVLGMNNSALSMSNNALSNGVLNPTTNMTSITSTNTAAFNTIPSALPSTVITNFPPTKSPSLSLSPLMEIPEHRAAITSIMSHYHKQR